MPANPKAIAIMHRPIHNDILYLLFYFNTNSYTPEQLTEDLAMMPKAAQDEARRDIFALLANQALGAAKFRRVTACTVQDDETARQFFHDVFAYAFKGGTEPHMPDYTR